MEKSPGHRQHPDHAVREQHLDQLMRVEINGQRVAQSHDIIVVDEDGNPKRYYFPRADVDMAKLQRTDTTSHCPFKGDAHYYSVNLGRKTLQDAAWVYEDPYEEHADLKDRVAFYEGEMPEIMITALA